MGGGLGTGFSTTNTESWNGTCWSNTTAAPHSKKYAMGGGTQTSAVVAGGVQYPPSITALSTAETWNGSAWTEVGAINTARGNGGRAAGSSTDALIFGGSPPPALAVTEYWDGTSWTEVADLGTAAASNAGTGTTTAGLSIGNGSPNNGQTEEWLVPGSVQIAQIGQVWYSDTSNVLKGFSQALGTGTWASTGSLNTVRPNNLGGGSGTQIAALAFGGYTIPVGVTNKTESYNGSTWTETGHTMNTARYKTSGCGTQTATLAMGGNAVTPDTTALTEEYNGSTWAVKNTMPASKADGTAAGTTEAAKYYSGRGGPPSYTINTNVFDFDGTNWSVGTSNNTARSQGGGGGTSTDAVFVGGGPPIVANYEAWNGSAWVEKADLNTGRRAAAASVTNTDSVMLAGGEGGYKLTELFDGTSWSEQADQANEHYNNASATTSATAALAISNTDSPYALCEEWTIPSITAIKTFTSS